MRDNLLRETFVIGLVTICVGFLSTRILSQNTHPKLDDPKLFVMLLNYFIIGAILHLLFEFMGYNKFFCETEFKD